MIVTRKKRIFHGLLAGFLSTALLVPSLGFSDSSGSFEIDEERPPAPKTKPKVVYQPDKTPTEGRLSCPEGGCKTGTHKDPTLKPIYPRANTSSEREECYRLHLLSVAKQKVAAWYGNRGHSVGYCARGVRQMMTAAGMNPIGGLGDAYHWKRDGKLKQLGFKDIYYPGMQPWQAPPGAILIFRGPMTMATNGYLPRKRDRPRGMSAGNWVGHVTIKGDNGYYYTDGRTLDPAVKNRFLAGVFVPDSGAMFSPWVKQKCGDL